MKKVLFILLISLSVIINAQQQNLPLNREFNLANEKVFNQKETQVHTSSKPIIQSSITFQLGDASQVNEIEIPNEYNINLRKEPKRDRSWLIRKMFFENFIVVDTGNFYMTIDPLFNGEFGKDSEDKSGRTLYKNTRGAIIRANVGEKFSFETSFYENQAVFPLYMDSYVRSKSAFRVVGVVPGQGRVKAFKTNGFDFASSSAIVTYAPSKTFTFQLGTGKNFIGDGYRSLLLSDFSFNYPFFKGIATFGKQKQFQYTKLNASLSSVFRRDLGSTPEALFQRKTMSTHYFSWLASKWLNIGFFESTLWQTEDSSGTKPFQFQQLNPVIGVNTLTTSFNEANHSIIGTNIKFKLPYDFVLYNQFVYDGDSKFGYQAGLKYYGINGLTLQAEYNAVEPLTYSSEIPLQAYTNYNEPIAHPMGNNFQEVVGIINYKYKRAFTQIKVIQAKINGTNLSIIQPHIGYIVNPKNNMTVLTGLTIRDDSFTNTNYIYFGFRTNLRNLYDDF